MRIKETWQKLIMSFKINWREHLSQIQAMGNLEQFIKYTGTTKIPLDSFYSFELNISENVMIALYIYLLNFMY